MGLRGKTAPTAESVAPGVRAQEQKEDAREQRAVGAVDHVPASRKRKVTSSSSSIGIARKGPGRLLLILSPGRCGSRSLVLLIAIAGPEDVRPLHEWKQWDLPWALSESSRLAVVAKVLSPLKTELDAGHDVVLSGLCYIQYAKEILIYFTKYSPQVFTQMRTPARLISSYVAIIESKRCNFRPWKYPQYPKKLNPDEDTRA